MKAHPEGGGADVEQGFSSITARLHSREKRRATQEGKGETVTEAETWIVNSWEALGGSASKGIGDEAHVRAAIRRARDRGLNQSLLINMGGVCLAIEGAKTLGAFELSDGARGWAWIEGMSEAQEVRVKNAFTREPLNPISDALREVFPRGS
jgi:hypothetical protein